MTQLELLQVFLNDRLTAAARDIFVAVQEAVVEYQREIQRSKDENERLRRLLNAAAQRLLLQAEAPSAPPPEDGHLCESDWKSRVELLLRKEPKEKSVLDGSQDTRGRDCSHVEQKKPHPLLASSVSPSPPTARETKTESAEKMDQSNFCTTTNSPDPPKPEHQVNMGLSVPQIKNTRRLKLPRSSHTSQSVQRWHSCKECSKSFSFACQLEVHMRWHTKEKPFSCSVCKKSFTTVSMLRRHHRIHTGEKPFHCHVCGKCFNQSAHLNTHFRLHTRDTAGWSRTAQGK